MCGICGIVLPDGECIDPDVLVAMRDTMHRRGPDEAGLHISPPCALAHRRLSIIDLDTGTQPISNEDGTVWVICNGEIYNFPELREQLQAKGHTFTTLSDTEVIVHQYEEQGERCLEQLTGMFALAIWDARQRKLLLARDRMGQKPLYYAERDGRFAFASELKALAKWPPLEPRLSLPSLSRYLFYEYVPSPHAIYEGVHKLNRAGALVWQNGRVRRWTYWEPRFYDGRKLAITLDEAAEELWRLFRESVRKRLVSDVPLGVFLSGGIDSSSVVAAMSELMDPGNIKTFAIGFQEKSFDESDHARLVAETFGTDHREDTLSAEGMMELLPDVAAWLDEPFADASVLPTYLLSRFTRQHVTVALGGDGGDELFAGYPTFQAARAARLWRMVPPPVQTLVAGAAQWLPVSHDNISLDFKIKQFAKGAAHRPELANQIWIGSFTPAEQRRLLTREVREALGDHDPAAEHVALAQRMPKQDWIQRLIAVYCQTYLQEDILTKVDRASMACSLEVRAPLLDHHFVEFVHGLPSEWKLSPQWQMKHVLKKAVTGRLPTETIHRPKKGFGIPVAKWISGKLKPLATDMLSPSRLRRQGLFEPRPVRRLLDDHFSRRRDNRKPLWTLLMFQLWYDRYGAAH